MATTELKNLKVDTLHHNLVKELSRLSGMRMQAIVEQAIRDHYRQQARRLR